MVRKARYLVVQVDISLDSKEQIKERYSNVANALKALQEVSPESSLRSLYLSIAEPHFRYCSSEWGCSGSSALLQLQKLQNRAARILPNSAFNVTSSRLIKNLGWMSIGDLISFELKQLVYKLSKNKSPQYK